MFVVVVNYFLIFVWFINRLYCVVDKFKVVGQCCFFVSYGISVYLQFVFIEELVILFSDFDVMMVENLFFKMCSDYIDFWYSLFKFVDYVI